MTWPNQYVMFLVVASATRMATDWTDYYFLAIAMFVFYVLFRLSYIWDSRHLGTPKPERHWTGHPIDTSTIASRVHHIRENYEAEIPPHELAFKRALLVESKREEIARQPFFQHPEPPEPPEEEEHGHALLII